MNKKVLLFLLICMAGFSLADACGPESINREFSLFLKTFNRSNPFYYYYFNGNSFDFGDQSNSRADQKQPNDLEWVQLLDGQFESNQIQAFLRRTDAVAPNSIEMRIQNYLRKNKPDVLDYIKQLWAYQDYSHKYYDKWNYQSYVYKKDSAVLFENIEKTKTIYKKTESVNLKWRCAYHMVRMAHFHKYTTTASKLYSEFVDPLPKNKSVMELWCLGIKGGILKKQGRKEEAFLQYAKRFVKDTADYDNVYIDLKQLPNIDLEKVMPFCKNDADRLAVIIAKSINTSGYNLQVVKYGNDYLQNEENLKFVYQRELQKLEADYIRGKLMDHRADERLAFSDDLQLPQDIEFASLLNFTKQKASKPSADAYWHNALAYLHIVRRDYASANQHLKFARSNSSKKSLDIAQSKMLTFLIAAMQGTEINTDELANFILDFHSDKTIADDDKNSFAIFSYNFILPRLLQQGKRTEAIVTAMIRDESIPFDYYYDGDNQRSDSIDIFNSNQMARYYLNYVLDENEFIQTIADIKLGENKFANGLQKKFKFFYKQADYNRFLLYKKVRQQDWDGALALLPQAGEFSSRSFAKPFVMHYDDIRTPNSQDSAQGLLSAREYLVLGKELKRATKKRNADAQFRYGQYLYHMTYYGYNRHLMDDNSYEYRKYNTPIYYAHTKIETEEWYYWFHKRYDVQLSQQALSYYDCSIAMAQFKRALKYAKDKEIKAKINFMLARCYQKNAPLPEFKKDKRYGYMREQAVAYKGKKYFGYSYHSFINPYFKELKNNYASTKTYKEAFEECSYLRMFLD